MKLSLGDTPLRLQRWLFAYGTCQHPVNTGAAPVWQWGLPVAGIAEVETS